MTLIDKKQLLSDIVNLKMPLGISSQDVDATYFEGYWAGKSQMQSKIIDIINKQRVAELEKPKKKRKFRAMTNGEYCDKWHSKHKYCLSSGGTERCPLFVSKTCFKEDVNKPLVINGKYILIEVKE